MICEGLKNVIKINGNKIRKIAMCKDVLNVNG